MATSWIQVRRVSPRPPTLVRQCPGFQHAAFCLRTEGRLEQSAHFRTFVRRGALVDLLSKALLYAEVEAHWRADAVTTACAQPFSLLAPHACAADARAQPLPVAERLKEALDAAPARDAASVAAGKRKAVAVDDGASAKRPRTDGDPDRMDTAPEGPPAPAPAPAQAPAPPPAPAAEAGASIRAVSEPAVVDAAPQGPASRRQSLFLSPR
jgi:transducin (beta)-like 1